MMWVIIIVILVNNNDEEENPVFIYLQYCLNSNRSFRKKLSQSTLHERKKSFLSFT